MVLPPKDFTVLEGVLSHLGADSYDGLGKAMELVLNAAMRLEREQHLNASDYERTASRTGYANGFKPKTLQTRVGELALQVPQTRDAFYPSSLEKGVRSERALRVAIAEMYVQGVSTKKVAKITEELCGMEVSSAQVSRVSQELDEHLSTWRDRPLGEYRYVWLDARYEKIRVDRRVVDCAVLVALGVNAEGQREVIGVSVSLSEAEVHWRQFLQSLVGRGLSGVQLLISDDHAGLGAARRAVFPSVPWQRCQFHLQQNAQAYVTKLSDRPIVAEKIRAIFNAPNVDEAKRLLQLAVDEYTESNTQLAEWMENNLEQGFTVFTVAPQAHWKKLRTSNPLERLNKEIKRRTRVVGIFPNTASCLRLVSAILMEQSEDWLVGKTYMKL
jgi:putative transposase